MQQQTVKSVAPDFEARQSCREAEHLLHLFSRQFEAVESAQLADNTGDKGVAGADRIYDRFPFMMRRCPRWRVERFQGPLPGLLRVGAALAPSTEEPGAGT